MRSRLISAAVRNPEAAKDDERRTPALGHVLNHETSRHRRQEEPLAIGQRAQGHACQYNAAEIQFQDAFDIPFLVEFSQAVGQITRIGRLVTSDGGADLVVNPPSDLGIGVVLDAVLGVAIMAAFLVES